MLATLRASVFSLVLDGLAGVVFGIALPPPLVIVHLVRSAHKKPLPDCIWQGPRVAMLVYRLVGDVFGRQVETCGHP